ncbi:MAG: VOC family protein [Candidatus Binataceae bacterium]
MSAVKAIPDGYHAIQPYVIIKDAANLIEFLKSAYDGIEVSRELQNGQIVHAEVRIGDSVFITTEATAAHPPAPTTVYLYVADVDATYRRALQAGATSLGEPEDKPYGDRGAGVKDPCGNIWWLASHIRDLEHHRRMFAAARG